MKDLLNANFFRLKKDKTFKIFITIAITITILRILLGYQQMQKIETAGINIETIIIDFMQIIGIFIAMFVSLFVGRDYSYGIIRNKIIAGKTRTNIYLSNLVVSIFATTICEIICILIILTIGILILDKSTILVSQLLFTIFNILLIIGVYCSIFNLISMWCSETTISVIACTIAFIAIFVICAYLQGIISIDKEIINKTFDEAGNEHIVSAIPNPNYPGEIKQNIAKMVYYAFPTGQINELSNKENLEKIPIYAIGSICIINIIGILFFRRKELK